MTTTTAEPDTGERRRVAVENMADQLAWWVAGPGAPPPPSVAAMPAEEQQALWLRIDQAAHAYGGQPSIQSLLKQLMTSRSGGRVQAGVVEQPGQGAD